MAKIEPSTSINGANENVLEIDGCVSSYICPLGKTTNPLRFRSRASLLDLIAGDSGKSRIADSGLSIDRWDGIASTQLFRSLIQPGIE